MEKRLLISLCMIVKNEEQWLEKCLDSICHIVDEIIIVDTGSTDKTKEICNRYNSKVYDFVWKESFAEARNFGIEKAQGQWILWLDADEEIVFENAEKFRKMVEEEENDILMIPLINYYGELPPDPNRSYLYAAHRLFRNYKGFKFVGNIHEHLNIQEICKHGASKIMPYTKIHHYGYMDSVIERKKKHERNLHMLEKEKNCPDYNPWIDYHIASEYYRVKKYEEAFKQVNISILRFLQRKQMPPSLLYKLKYDILIITGNFDKAWAGIESAIILYPEYVDLHFYKGLILYAKKRFEEAILVFKYCLELGEAESNRHLTLVGCGGYQAWYFIGLCYENLGNFAKAVEAYTQVAHLYPGHQEAQSKLLQLK